MTELFSEDEVITSITRLTRRQLDRFVEIDFIKPRTEEGKFVFYSIDVARLELLCDLTHDLDLDETALSVTLSLIDQLHTARQDLAAVSGLLNGLPADLQKRILTELTGP
jgi:chaperone modulatory protein CbpM